MKLIKHNTLKKLHRRIRELESREIESKKQIDKINSLYRNNLGNPLMHKIMMCIMTPKAKEPKCKNQRNP